MKKLFYPAVFEIEEDGRYSVHFPDIQGCNTCGEDIENAYEMANEALGLNLSHIYDQKEPIPPSSKPNDIKLEENQFIVVVEFDMLAYLKKNDSRAVKKTLSVPSWLNDIALAQGLNFSQVLQEGLLSKISSK